MPKSIAIVGVGAIGCEFATFFSSFGVEVTLIGRGSQLLPHEDEDVSKALLRAFKKRGVRVMTSATISKAEIKVEEVELFINQGEPIKCELVLVAAGRTPYVEGLNLQNAGINRDEKGFIEVSPSFQTSQSHVYAIWDCVNTPGFAHAARAEAKVAASNVINARKEENASVSPSAVFSDPSVASCGLREKEAKARGIEVEVKKAYFKANAKAKIHGDDSGFVKIIVCPKSGIILGAAIIGAQATEIIHELLLAIEKKLTTRELKGMIHVHPSVSEIISYL